MPEIVEVRKLQLQLRPAWKGNRVTRITAPSDSPEPKSYLLGEWEEFVGLLKGEDVKEIYREGKYLLVQFSGGRFWRIHLNSTGWFLPGNLTAIRSTKINPVYQNFLHKLNPLSRRMSFHFRDGQVWNYHDPRTWGKWWVDTTAFSRSNSPDWLTVPNLAIQSLITHQGKRSVKDVLCDQALTQGLGNYLSCEILARAAILPFRRWDSLTEEEKGLLVTEIHPFLEACLEANNHDHWWVFKRKECGNCGDPVIYSKDHPGSSRGSYYCKTCQI